MDSVIIKDQYDLSWRISDGDILWEEAKFAVAAADGKPVMWPLEKLAKGRGWGWWTVYKKIDEFEEELAKTVPNPNEKRLIELGKEYTSTELRDLLQTFGSYLGSLYHIEGIIEGQVFALKKGLNTALSVAQVQLDSKTTSVSGREAEVLAGSELLRETSKMEINTGAILLVLKGWISSYEKAWETTSRLITIQLGDIQLATGRHA